jgi:hypothetical protein
VEVFNKYNLKEGLFSSISEKLISKKIHKYGCSAAFHTDITMCTYISSLSNRQFLKLLDLLNIDSVDFEKT